MLFDDGDDKFGLLQRLLQRLMGVEEMQQAFNEFHPEKIPGYHDYFTFVKRKMDLQTVKRNLKKKKYSSIESVIDDITLVFSNAIRYKKTPSVYQGLAKTFLSIYVPYLRLRLQASSLSARWQQMAQHILAHLITNDPESTKWFLSPVDLKQFTDYTEKINGRPTDYSKIKKKLEKGKYSDLQGFRKEMLRVTQNCREFNRAAFWDKLCANVDKNFEILYNKAKTLLAREGKGGGSSRLTTTAVQNGRKSPAVTDNGDDTLSSHKKIPGDQPTDAIIMKLKFVLHELLKAAKDDSKDYEILKNVEKRLETNALPMVSDFIRDVHQAYSHREGGGGRLEKIFDEQLKKFQLIKIKQSMFDESFSSSSSKKRSLASAYDPNTTSSRSSSSSSLSPHLSPSPSLFPRHIT
mmetsp:Transcript_28376/g.48194  ORF Transcript_28376/g.48194 Transcript_28376/m.48194 type:complete len:407 (-) Transcript_28376:154-1374(-)